MDHPNPTEGELAILRVLWKKGAPASVHEVHAELLKSKDTAYTTVLKMLTIMAEKGLVRRDESERRHLYAPVFQESVVQSSLLKDFIRNAFAGSAFRLFQSALHEDATSQKELEEIERLIAQARKRKKADKR